MKTILETKEIGKVFGEGNSKVTAVEAVTLALEEQQVLLITGPSGSGKTTLLSMMGCILKPSSGQVIIEGQSIDRQEENILSDVRKKYFGFVFQSFNLFPFLTAVENVELVLKLKKYNRAEIRNEAIDLLEKVGLGKRVHFYPENLSGGQKQRVAFARALAGGPPIILADEPTASLDSKTGLEVLTLLRDLAEDFRKAIAIVSHDPKAVAFAHRVIFMEDGKIKL
jgi:putative ABC transport system ATP-binding protein